MTLPRRDRRTTYAIVVADDPAQRDELTRLARSAGTVACVCGDMGSVMANADPADPPAFVLSDMDTASRMDWQVCRQLRFPQVGTLQQVPILVVCSEDAALAVERAVGKFRLGRVFMVTGEPEPFAARVLPFLGEFREEARPLPAASPAGAGDGPNESETRYRMLFDRSPDGVVILDPATARILDFNDRACQQLGYSRQEFAKLSVRDVEVVESEEETRRRIEGVVKEGWADFDTLQKTKQGDIRNIHVTAQYFTAGGQPFYLCIWRDITARIRAEEAVRHLSIRYKNILDDIPDIIMEVDTRKVYTWANRAGYEFFGPDVIGKEAAHYFEGEQKTYELVQPLFDGNENLHCLESYQRRKDGENRLLAWWSRVLKDDQGRVTGAMSSARDMTDVRRHEKERDLVVEVLRLANASQNIREMVREAVAFFHRLSGCEAVGLRLREGEDFPYWETVGLAPEFILRENRLCSRDAEGRLMEEPDGTPVIQNLCGTVIQGRTDPRRPYFSSYGSFWTNSTSELLAKAEAEELPLCNRGRCIDEGFESLALIPLRSGQECIGLLQILDRRPHRFHGEKVSLWERLSSYLAMGLARCLAEERLRRSEERLRLATKAANDVIWDWDLLKDEYQWSDAGVPVFGWAEAVKAPQTVDWWWKRIHPEDRRKVLKNFHATVDNPSRSHWEDTYRFQKADGSFASVFDRGYIVRSDAGRAVRMIGSLLDLTESRRREEELLLHSLVLDQIQDHVTVTNLDGIITYVNRAQCKTFGLPSEAFLGKPTEFFGDDSQHGATQQEIVEKAKRFGRWRGEVVNTTPDGQRRVMDCRVQTVRNSQGDPIALCGIATDITDQRQSDQARRESEEKYTTLFREMLDGFILMEVERDEAEVPRDLRFLAINPSFERMSGMKSADIVGQPLSKVMPRLSRAHIESFINVALNGEPLFFTDYSPALKKHFEVTAFRPGPNQFAGIVTDVTMRKVLEEQLQQNQKMESVGRLAGGVAHDLNNLLTPILGYGEMLIDEIAPENPLHTSALEIVRASTRARDLVGQLLAFSRKQTLAYKTIDVNRAVEGFSNLLRRTLREDIRFEITLDPSLQKIRADIGQLEQVIMNLSVNAQDAMPKGGVLSLGTTMAFLEEGDGDLHPDMKPGEYVVLTIRDTGSGIDEETRTHIFEPFFSTKGQLGTGLGLATVYGIVRQHGGNICVFSEPGRGTIFRVYLPACPEPCAELPVESPGLPEPAATGTETILVVEDNAQVHRLTSTLLRLRGYTVLEAGSGSEALSLLDSGNQPVHLLLTDVVMPGMDGRQLYAQASETRPDLRVLYMSGYSQDVIAHHGILDEGVQFIQKPFTLQGLAAKVRETLDR